MRKRFATRLIAVLAGFFAVATFSRADEVTIPLDQVPAAVMKAVKEKYPKAEIKGAEKDDSDGKVMYEINLEENGHKIDVSVKPDGTIDSSEKMIEVNDLPKKISEAVKDKYPKATLKSSEEVIEDGKTSFEVIIDVEKKTREVILDPDGKILEDDEVKTNPADNSEGLEYTSSFTVNSAELSSTGRNPYFVLEPGFQLYYEGRDEDEPVTLTITVLDETKKVGDITTRIVEERETVGGKVVEVSRNYFAICERTNNVYYFGEDVDMYKNGKVVNHDGSWLSGRDGAIFGLAMPGSPLLGARYQQEVAPKVALDRAEVVSLSETLKTPAGTFKDCLKTLETTPLEPETKEAKLYAPGIGLIKDGPVTLVRFGMVKK